MKSISDKSCKFNLSTLIYERFKINEFCFSMLMGKDLPSGMYVTPRMCENSDAKFKCTKGWDGVVFV